MNRWLLGGAAGALLAGAPLAARADDIPVPIPPVFGTPTPQSSAPPGSPGTPVPGTAPAPKPAGTGPASPNATRAPSPLNRGGDAGQLQTSSAPAAAPLPVAVTGNAPAPAAPSPRPAGSVPGLAAALGLAAVVGALLLVAVVGPRRIASALKRPRSIHPGAAAVDYDRVSRTRGLRPARPRRPRSA